MEIVSEQGRDDLAKVYVARTNGFLIEFVESIQAPHPINEKWVVIVSTSVGCPVGCLMCDAGGDYSRLLSTEEIMKQIDFLVNKRFGSRKVPVKKFKVQFARMGEPSFNPAVLNALDILPGLYEAPGLLPSISSVAPSGSGRFFEALLKLKDEHYRGRFQLQFSIHTTDLGKRRDLIPVKSWSFKDISEYGKRFRSKNDRKVILNFAPVKGFPIDPNVIAEHFDTGSFIIKFTPLNPTIRTVKSKLEPLIDSIDPEAWQGILNGFNNLGYQTILSIGDLDENKIGSNCGQYVQRNITR
jgi:23S rRNA (adenine2503-C2)-methyltransferase